MIYPEYHWSGVLRASRLAIVFALFSSPMCQAAAKPVEAHQWVESRSQNFVIRSDTSRKVAEATLQKLELLRATILKLTSINADKLSSPKLIYLFHSTDDYLESGYGDIIKGTHRTHYVKARKGYLTDENGDAVLIATAIFGNRRYSFHPWRGILREYMHFLHGTGGSAALPAWYRYGVEYLFDGGYQIGTIRVWRAAGMDGNVHQGALGLEFMV